MLKLSLMDLASSTMKSVSAATVNRGFLGLLWKSGSQLIWNKHSFSSVIYKLNFFKNLVCFPIYVIFIGSIYYFKSFVTIAIVYSNVHQCWGIKYLTDNKHIFTSFRYWRYNVVLIIITIIIIN